MKKKNLNLFITLLLTFLISITGVKAATVKEVTLNDFVENPLNLPYHTNQQITVTAPSGATVKEWTNDDGRPYKVVTIPKDNVSASGTQVKVTYPKVGTYNGKEIGVNATYTVYKYRDGDVIGKIGEEVRKHTGIIIAIPYDFTATGTGFFNSEYEKISYDFFYVSNKESVDVKNAYFTFHSLNYTENAGDESILFSSEVASKISEVSTFKGKSNIDVKNTAGTTESGLAYALAIVPNSNDFHDGHPGYEDYLPNSATIKYSGKLEYIIASNSGTTGISNSAIWYQPSSSPISGTIPEEPVKSIEKDKKMVKEATYEAGSEVVFVVDQKVNSIWENIMVRYTGFSIVDSLPKEVDYVNAKMYDNKGNELGSNDGTIVYDQTNHKVTWTASSAFLGSMPLKGETYTLKITVKLNSSMKDTTKNKAQSIFNNTYKPESNEVIVNQGYKLIVHHYIEGTTTKLAEDEEYLKEYKEEYKTSKSDKVPNEYKLSKTPSNAEGIIEGNTEVTYYYKAPLVVNVPKTKANTIFIGLGLSILVIVAIAGFYVFKTKSVKKH